MSVVASELDCYKTVVNAFVSKKQGACCLPASCVLYELLQKHNHSSAKLIQGYQVFSQRYASWHAWVVTDSNKFDPGGEINIETQPNKETKARLKAVKSELCPEISSCVSRIDLETKQERDICTRNNEELERFQTNPKEFWKQVKREYVIAWNIRQELIGSYCPLPQQEKEEKKSGASAAISPCTGCGQQIPKSNYSSSQLKLPASKRKCKHCIAASSNPLI